MSEWVNEKMSIPIYPYTHLPLYPFTS